MEYLVRLAMQARHIFHIFRQGYCSVAALEERVKSVRDLLEIALRSDGGECEGEFLLCLLRRRQAGA